MSVIVIAYNPSNEVLLCTSAKWVMDTKTTNEEKEAVAKSQRSATEKKEDAFVDLYATRPEGTLMTDPVKRNGYFSAKFAYEDVHLKPGFIKGKKEPGDVSPGAAMAREFEEETGYTIEPSRFKQVGRDYDRDIFKLYVSNEEASGILRSWQTLKGEGRGELTDLKWVPIGRVSSMDLNTPSRRILGYLAPRGGMYKISDRVSKMAKTRRVTCKTRSHCIGLKHRLCKRTQGCEVASRKRRRFCRTARNRKIIRK